MNKLYRGILSTKFKLKKFNELVFLLLVFGTLSCTDEQLVFQPNVESVLVHNLEDYQSDSNSIFVGDSNEIWSQLHSNNTIELEDSIYIFDRPIEISNLANLKITTKNGGRAKLCFRFNGAAIKVIQSVGITIENIELDNYIDYENWSTYFRSGYDTGRIDIRHSDGVEIKKLVLGQLNLGAIENSQIYIFNSLDCKVDSCTVNRARGELISIIGSNDCVVSNNDVYGGNSIDGVSANSGIETAGSLYMGWYRGYRTNIINNRVYDCAAAFITVNDRETLVEGNFIDVTKPNQNCGPGLRFGHSVSEELRAVNFIARGNSINNLDGIDLAPDDYFDPFGIRVDASRTDYNYGTGIIENNIILNCSGGIQVSDLPGQNIEIRSNRINSSDFGVNIWSVPEMPHNVSLYENRIRVNELYAEYAIRYRSSFGSIQKNKVLGSRIGIKLEDSSGILVDSNWIGDSGEYCINLTNCQFIQMINNEGSVKYSAVIYSTNSNNLHFEMNKLWLLEGSSLFAIYAQGSFSDFTFNNNVHNYPNLMNF